MNVIQVDSYLYGVVPCEMQSNYEMEALKAQAVCARSFALTRVGYHAPRFNTKLPFASGKSALNCGYAPFFSPSIKKE